MVYGVLPYAGNFHSGPGCQRFRAGYRFFRVLVLAREIFVIPFISYSYDWLTKFDKVKTYFMKLASSNACKKLNNGGFALVLIATPLLGSWGIGVAGKMIGMDRKRLFLASAIGIAIYGTIVGILTQLGIEAVFNPN